MLRSKIEAEEARATKKAQSRRGRKAEQAEEIGDDDHAFKEITQGFEKAFVKSSDFLGVGQPTGFVRSEAISLSRGSLYEGGTGRKTKTLPLAGYFEFHNKSTEVVCVKLVERGEEAADVKFEAARPSFICIPPGEIVSGLFDKELAFLELIVLFDNPNPIPRNASLVYDTQARGVTADVISPAAKVSLFKSLTLYSIKSKSKNVFVKYKGRGGVEPRRGNSVARVGLFARLSGHRFGKGLIDYATNVDSVSLLKKLSI